MGQKAGKLRSIIRRKNLSVILHLQKLLPFISSGNYSSEKPKQIYD